MQVLPQLQEWLTLRSLLGDSDDRVLCLPNGSAIDNETVRNICKLVHFIVKNSKQIGNAMKKEADA